MGGSPMRDWLRREKARELRDLFAVLEDIDAPWRQRIEAQDRLYRHHGNPPLPPLSWASLEPNTRWFL